MEDLEYISEDYVPEDYDSDIEYDVVHDYTEQYY